jgi:MoaA/NifB/PqqE/SkfB family radical SAM enzyme
MEEMRFNSPRSQHRIDLASAIPLPAPFLVYVDTTNICNFGCHFCPTGDPAVLKQVGRPKGTMTQELFDKIVGDFREFGVPIKRLFLAKDGEPTLDKRMPALIRQSKEAGIAEMLTINTNGSRLSPEMCHALVDSGLDLLTISVEAVNNEEYKRITQVKFDYRKLVDSVAYLYSIRKQCKVYAKIIDFDLSPEDRMTFYRDFSPISDYITIDHPRGWSYDSMKDFTMGATSARTGFMDLAELTPRKVCPFAFFSMAINFNGTVSVCCVDWSYATVVGDVREESLLDIWNGERFFEFRKMHLEGRRRENLACGTCYTINGLPDDYLDGKAGEILSKIEAARSVRV